MCGILGCLGNRDVSVKTIRGFAYNNLHFIASRGPDNSGVKLIPNHNLVMCMTTLSITNPSRNYGPYHTKDERYLLSYNGEIYNGDELCARFNIKLEPNENDAHILLRLLSTVSVECLSYINGMFAFSFYDSITEKIIIGVDKFSQKTLFWKLNHFGFIFSSNYQALRDSSSEGLNIDSNFDIFEDFQERSTPSNRIHRLLGGTYIEYSKDNLYPIERKYIQYKKPSDNLDVSKALSIAANNYATYQPKALLLSGGLDSGILAALIKPDVAYTITFNDHDAFNEENNAQKVCEIYGIDHVVIRPTLEDLNNFITDISMRLQYPIGNSSIFPEYMAYKTMQEDGIRVCYNGVGADEFFLGYERMRLFYAVANNLKFHIPSNYRPLKTRLDSIYNPETPMHENYFKFITRLPIDMAKSISSIPECSQPEQTIGEMMTRLEVKHMLPGLLRTTDALSGSFGIEVRLPFLDLNVVDISKKIPEYEKLDINLGTKLPLRKIAYNLELPESIINDPVKRGFAAPYGMWMHRKQSLSSMFDRKPFTSKIIQSYKKLLHTRGRFDLRK